MDEPIFLQPNKPSPKSGPKPAPKPEQPKKRPVSKFLLRLIALVVLLPVAFFLSPFGILRLVWLAFPIAELFSCAMCAFFLYRVYRRDVLPLAQA